MPLTETPKALPFHIEREAIEKAFLAYRTSLIVTHTANADSVNYPNLSTELFEHFF